jgi:hypothetical protein
MMASIQNLNATEYSITQNIPRHVEGVGISGARIVDDTLDETHYALGTSWASELATITLQEEEFREQ